MATLNTGDKVTWKWGEGVAEGTIDTVYTGDVTKTLKGSEVTRKGSESSPAYLIKQSDGTEVLKSHSEVTEHEEN
ncbi:DUF2945 domain-containing protein [Planctobacterium marinum]|uniref:Hypervirulence associated protein TUDOR domain-containing protein n=1 Tax=Planctobacterium marinum TaxID=1631968 RepID=A0AA48HGA6_9ALTE|nr:hypothetical protein MACH26_03150 [Planctobacterium marinum]